MTETAFRLSADDLMAYQYAVRDRLTKEMPKPWQHKDSIRALALMAITALVTGGLMGLFPAVFGRPLELMELLIGMLFGGGLVLGMIWLSFRDQSRRLTRTDGPVQGVQTLRLTNDGVTVSSDKVEARYVWAAIEHVSEARGLVILWIEPGVGIAVPGHAFASSAEREAFMREIEGRRAAAGLPRVGSFS